MTAYYQIEPEVAGGWGESTEADTSTHPPTVYFLHYEFQGWLGDELLESFPCFLVTQRVGQALQEAGLVGYRLEEVKVSVSSEFLEAQGDLMLPEFHRLKITGRAGQADFGMSESLLLTVSEQALAVLRRFPLAHAEVSEWE